MGTYCVNTRTSITLDLAKLRQGYLDRTSEFLTLMATNHLDMSKLSFKECCEGLGSRTVESDPTGRGFNIVEVSGETKVGWQDGYFAALAPYATPGSYAEFQCREYGTWRYIKHGDVFVEQAGVVSVEYPVLPKLKKARLVSVGRMACSTPNVQRVAK